MGKPSLDPVVWKPPAATARVKQDRSERSFVLDVFDMPGKGPEDVVVDSSGHVWAGLDDGRILRISPDGRTIKTVADTGGRPLGVELDPGGDLRICDAHLGVLNLDPRTGRLTTVVDQINGRPMVFCNNAAVAQDGTVFFSDSSTKFGIEHYRGELFEHNATGRLFRRTPDGAVDLVSDGFHFANGVALAPDESWVAVAQTTAYSLDRIWLTGPSAGRREPFVENLPAFPDNISTGSDGLIWVALPAPRDPILDLLLPRPPLLRKLAWAMPHKLQPHEKKTVWVQAFDGDGNLVHDLQTSSPRFWMATGVREIDGVVWLGSLAAPAIARSNLS